MMNKIRQKNNGYLQATFILATQAKSSLSLESFVWLPLGGEKTEKNRNRKTSIKQNRNENEIKASNW